MDYELEAWIRSSILSPALNLNSKMTWQERVQYSVGHAINDFFSLDPYVRMHTPIQVMLNRRWPRSKESFRSSLHYWEIYNRVVSTLTHLASAYLNESPMIMYEQLETNVREFDLDLSVIFHTVWQQTQGHGFKIQKFLVEDHPELVRAFLHLANVFWNSAYGCPPDEVEIVLLLSGDRYTYTKEMPDLQQSLDYVYLLYETVELDKMSGHLETKEEHRDSACFVQ